MNWPQKRPSLHVTVNRVTCLFTVANFALTSHSSRHLWQNTIATPTSKIISKKIAFFFRSHFCFIFARSERPNFFFFFKPNCFDSLFCCSIGVWIGTEMDYQTRVVCPNCQRNYKSRKLLYRHLRQGCGEIASGYREDQPCHLPVYRCHVCPFISFIRGFLNQHLLNFHGKTSM